MNVSLMHTSERVLWHVLTKRGEKQNTRNGVLKPYFFAYILIKITPLPRRYVVIKMCEENVVLASSYSGRTISFIFFPFRRPESTLRSNAYFSIQSRWNKSAIFDERKHGLVFFCP